MRLLELLRATDLEVHLAMSRTAQVTLGYETAREPADIAAFANVMHASHDMAAAISGGAFRTIGMIVTSGSMRSLAEIATSAGPRCSPGRPNRHCGRRRRYLNRRVTE